MAIGLKTHIWNNNLKSMVLLCLYPFIIGALVWACAYAVHYTALPEMGTTAKYYYATSKGNLATDPGAVQISRVDAPVLFANNFIFTYWPLILGLVAGWFVIAYFFHTRMINSMSSAHPVSRSEEPELYNLFENLCIAEGVPMPQLNIIETHGRNAFASGINQKTYAITVTRGLLNSLQKDEIEAVLGHELAHIINNDVRLLMVTIIFTGMVGFFAQMVWSSIRRGMIFRRGSGRKGNGWVVIFAIAIILWIGYMATLFMRFAISRRREFMADAGSIEMTKNPSAMMRALMRIADRETIPALPGDVAMMCIENSHALFGLFATHPPIDQRIASISMATGEPIPDLPHKGPAEKSERMHTPKKDGNPWVITKRRH